jgi:hypothetical protein
MPLNVVPPRICFVNLRAAACRAIAVLRITFCGTFIFRPCALRVDVLCASRPIGSPRGPFTIEDVQVVNASPADRERLGLWPSDHAGVVATLTLRSGAGTD